MLAFVMLVLSFASCNNGNGNNEGGNEGGNEGENKELSSESLYVNKVENLPDGFIFGMDASCVPSLEASGVKYYDPDGNEKDVY